jgi:ribosomal protein S18 acetylase RimI-like enzyme
MNGSETPVTIRPMTTADAPAVFAFAQALPPHDLLFLPRDITHPKVLDAWVAELERGTLTSLVAVSGDRVVGNATIVCDKLSWSPHVAELRVVVSADARGRGLGRRLMEAAFALAVPMGVEKLIAQMTVDQTAAIGTFESMGYRAEALLRGHVKDRAGTKYDLVILSHDVAEFAARAAAYGRLDAN